MDEIGEKLSSVCSEKDEISESEEFRTTQAIDVMKRLSGGENGITKEMFEDLTKESQPTRPPRPSKLAKMRLNVSDFELKGKKYSKPRKGDPEKATVNQTKLDTEENQEECVQEMKPQEGEVSKKDELRDSEVQSDTSDAIQVETEQQCIEKISLDLVDEMENSHAEEISSNSQDKIENSHIETSIHDSHDELENSQIEIEEQYSSAMKEKNSLCIEEETINLCVNAISESSNDSANRESLDVRVEAENPFTGFEKDDETPHLEKKIKRSVSEKEGSISNQDGLSSSLDSAVKENGIPVCEVKPLRDFRRRSSNKGDKRPDKAKPERRRKHSSTGSKNSSSSIEESTIQEVPEEVTESDRTSKAERLSGISKFLSLSSMNLSTIKDKKPKRRKSSSTMDIAGIGVNDVRPSDTPRQRPKNDTTRRTADDTTRKTTDDISPTTGIGYETAKFIAMMGAHVILACRDEQKAKQAIKKMNGEFQDEKAAGAKNIISDERLSLEFMKVDLSSLESTKAFIDAFKASGRKLHLLVCNAAIHSHTQVMTSDNFELTYQVNYLSHFLITISLLPIMKTSGSDVRIIQVSSEAHKHEKFDRKYAENGKPEEYNGYRCYANTKLFQIMSMYTIDKMLLDTDIEIACVNPGITDTKLYREHLPEGREGFKRTCYNCMGWVQTPRRGAACSIYAAVNPELKGCSRGYYMKSRSAPSFPSSAAQDKDLAEFVLECTRENLKGYLTPEIDKILDT
ncbi:hypothetical protein FSP39_016031 [Pinctada imbricata]|uniref:Uncharacterized protein n=1 Tax=Pinctada imbricata TaxID=66713 RepID=A0AA88YEU4_PINIB|nr:hypothetical protein FSP39_016031 [Pinctada imbricata]